MACVRVCPADAVAVEGAIVRIVDEACTRCGLCLPACPHDAIEALGDVSRALELALAGRAALILSVECAVHFYPATPNQVVNACYAAGVRAPPRAGRRGQRGGGGAPGRLGARGRGSPPPPPPARSPPGPAREP